MASVKKLQTLTGILDYPDPNNASTGTTEQQYQEFVKNHHEILSNIVDRTLWQPGTAYKVGQVITSPNMVANTVARVTKAGTTGSAEPTWSAAGNSLSDGTVTYSMMYQTVDYATQAEVSAGTNTTKIVTAAMLGRTIQTNLASESAVGINTTDKTVSCGVTGILPVTHGGTGANSLANITVGKASTLTGDTGLWDYLHRKGVNFSAPTLNAALNALGIFISSYNKETFPNQPSASGQLVNIPHGRSDTQSTQLWIDQPSGKLYHRGGDATHSINTEPFVRFLDTGDLSNISSASGVVAGNVSNANAWWVKLGGTIPLIIQGGYASVGRRQDITITFPVAYSKVLSIVGIPVVNAQNQEGKGLENIKTYSTTSFVYYSGYDIANKMLLWLSVGY